MFNVNKKNIICVNLTKEQHKVFTKVFRDMFGYGKTKYSWSISFAAKMTIAVIRAYRDYRDLLFATILSMLS